MALERSILHCDLNSFFASVACVHQPSLQLVPMAVAGDPRSRHGIILAKNDHAKRFGVQTAETIWQAMRKCPELVLVPPQQQEYLRYSRLVNEIYQRYTDLVEPFGIDESWLDVTGVSQLFGSGPEIADAIRRCVREELGLSLSVGVSFNKVFAKLGSDYQKPDATSIFLRENYKELVWPLPASALLFVGPASSQTLARLGIRSIGDLAGADRVLLTRKLGKAGGMLHDYANGRDDSPVRRVGEQPPLKSIGRGFTFPQDLHGEPAVRSALLTFCDEICHRLRRHELRATVLALSIKSPDFKRITRQAPLPQPSNLTRELCDLALALFRECWPPGAAVRALTVTAQQLQSTSSAQEQLSLFSKEVEPKREKQENLAKALDHIRDKYGKRALILGARLPKEPE